jgi:hypothetical protein
MHYSGIEQKEKCNDSIELESRPAITTYLFGTRICETFTLQARSQADFMIIMKLTWGFYFYKRNRPTAAGQLLAMSQKLLAIVLTKLLTRN